MKIYSLAVLSALLGLTFASTNSSEGLLKSDSLGDWKEAYTKASNFVSRLTNAQKLQLITGNDVNTTDGTFTALQFLDGSMGLQDYFYASAFSQSSALAMTWDKDAMYAQAKAVATEFYLKGIQVVDGPTSQPLGRTPWGGRLVETFGSDPYLNGIATGLTTKAYVDTGVIAGAKHYILNEQETNRTSSMGGTPGGGGGGGGPGSNSSRAMTSKRAVPGSSSSSDGTPYSSNVDDKTMHETYLWSFYDGVKNGLGAVMCAMTKVNGSLSCENSHILRNLLKSELGFPGMVFPDTMAQQHSLASAVNGLDYGSSSIWSSSTMQRFLSNGSLPQSLLDDMVIRNLMGYYHVHLDNGTQPSTADKDAYVDVRANHSKLIRANGAKSLVLLKNTNSALPLQRPHKMAIFGAHAGPAVAGPNTEFSVQGSGPTYQGHLATGTGSGQSSYPYLITPQAALTFRASQDGTMIRWILNDTYSGGSGSSLVMQGSDSTAVTPAISSYADNMDVCLVFLNALAGEGADRTELYNDDQDALVKSVASSCNNTVVVINTVGVRLVDQWIENENVTAVLYSSLLGQESGNSIVDVLYGDVNPSARLTHTIAKNESDYNVGICYTSQCNFTEGNYIDYRYFDAYNITPRYEFGHGLSYTTFSYTNLEITTNTMQTPKSTTELTLPPYPTSSIAIGGPPDLWTAIAHIALTVTNTGSRAGAEIPQLYISYPDEAAQPLRQLRGFERVEMDAGDSRTVRFALRRRDVSFWDVKTQQWGVKGGVYGVVVGGSSRDRRLVGEIRITV